MAAQPAPKCSVPHASLFPSILVLSAPLLPLLLSMLGREPRTSYKVGKCSPSSRIPRPPSEFCYFEKDGGPFFPQVPPSPGTLGFVPLCRGIEGSFKKKPVLRRIEALPQLPLFFPVPFPPCAHTPNPLLCISQDSGTGHSSAWETASRHPWWCDAPLLSPDPCSPLSPDLLVFVPMLRESSSYSAPSLQCPAHWSRGLNYLLTT